MPADRFVLRTKDLTKHYDGTAAVKGLNLAIKPGTITGLLGGNGAGKSTTIGMLLGLLTPTSGTVEILGYDLATHRDAVAPLINFSSPYVDLPNRLSVRQNLTVYGHLYGVESLKTRIAEMGDHLQMTDLLDRRHGSLSAGQRTRASLAKALLNRPRVLLLDEPTASLDPETAQWVRELLMNYRRDTGATLFLSSHNMQEVERMCDEVIMMKQGEAFATGTPDELMNRFDRTSMEEVFLDIARA